MSNHLLNNRYQIIQPLAQGGMGHTYIVTDTQLPSQPKRVVKQLKPASNNPLLLANVQRLFRQEAEVLEQLGSHPLIPTLFGYFEESGEFYLVQEYIEGTSLSAEMPLGQRWKEKEVIELLREILKILEFVHSHNVIHRDIKPDNIIRRKSDRKLVLIDFGAVKQIRNQQGSQISQISQTISIGTQGYIPTEAAQGKPRKCSDLYSVGIIGIQALTGILPIQLPEDEDGEVIWQNLVQISPEFAQFLSKMVKHYFKQRYQSTTEALEALKQINQTSNNKNQEYLPTLPITPNPPQDNKNQKYLPTVPIIPNSPQDKPKLINSLFLAIFCTSSLLVAGSFAAILYHKLENSESSNQSITTPSTPTPSPESTPTLKDILLGTWEGKYGLNHKQTSRLIIHSESNNVFKGIIETVGNRGNRFQLEIEATIEPNTKKITIQEVKLLSKSGGKWNLGTNEGRLSQNNQQISGQGADRRHKYAWYFYKTLN